MANAAVRISGTQPGVERAVAVAGELALVVEGAVAGKQASNWQLFTDQGEHALHQRPGHDVQGVGGEGRIECAISGLWPFAAAQVQRERCAQIAGRVGGVPGRNASMVFRQFTGLPDELRQLRRKVDAVLARA